jgi:hypothetical protein
VSILSEIAPPAHLSMHHAKESSERRSRGANRDTTVSPESAVALDNEGIEATRALSARRDTA